MTHLGTDSRVGSQRGRWAGTRARQQRLAPAHGFGGVNVTITHGGDRHNQKVEGLVELEARPVAAFELLGIREVIYRVDDPRRDEDKRRRREDEEHEQS